MKKLTYIFFILFTLSQLALGSNIPAQKNFSGDQVKTLSGTSEITSISINPNFRKVYNLEVDVDHVYRVQSKGILVHNTYSPVCLNNRKFSSNDPHVADSANAIEEVYPGHVVGVNTKNDHEVDIDLKNAIIEVKGGNGKGLTKQIIDRSNIGKPLICHALNLGYHATIDINKAGGIASGGSQGSLIDLIQIVAPDPN